MELTDQPVVPNTVVLTSRIFGVLMFVVQPMSTKVLGGGVGVSAAALTISSVGVGVVVAGSDVGVVVTGTSVATTSVPTTGGVEQMSPTPSPSESS